MSGRERLLRKTADRMVPEFMDRVARVNSDDNYVYRYSRIVLFGSYVNSDRQKIGDIDIGFQLEPRFDPDFVGWLSYAKWQEAPSGGLMYELSWPREEVLRAARGGNRYISMHDLGHDREAIESDVHVEMELPASDPVETILVPRCPFCRRTAVARLSYDPGNGAKRYSVACSHHTDNFVVSEDGFVDAARTWNIIFPQEWSV